MASVRPEVPAKFNPIRPVRASSWAGMAPVRPEASSKLKDIMPVRAPSWVGMGPVRPEAKLKLNRGYVVLVRCQHPRLLLTRPSRRARSTTSQIRTTIGIIKRRSHGDVDLVLFCVPLRLVFRGCLRALS
eukprot:4254872-Pyramimonas_sp.AAC.1